MSIFMYSNVVTDVFPGRTVFLHINGLNSNHKIIFPGRTVFYIASELYLSIFFRDERFLSSWDRANQGIHRNMRNDFFPGRTVFFWAVDFWM